MSEKNSEPSGRNESSDKDAQDASGFQKDSKRQEKEFSPWEFAGLGMEFAVIVVGSVYLGNYLDTKFHSSPFGLLGACLLGFSYGIYYIIYRTTLKK
ncbi:putative F0F1-ATPase subunit [Leptospira weilii serovar Topaz str. LT2116]|uniref:Putative F0F1-ATPase subunit n=2 Tax=Leptospira weilii TaxID=28184 RepID=M3G8S3_9LEPT|nr:AtpZ/AtpI family protein [Leptospira weilii]EMF82394.1 putative F0F1-ATPase subunit [Leptospira weilii serovar Topaz str. LT2116]EMY12285.1 putative F0F1-ATPase subunit [Leptospira weilii str. Ecochallenge]MCL8265991.1 AtpZ/AtpI family protein [Leptospira weilii]ULH29954.1 AtpZ/AtpI family protein [Leptospira weilii]